MSDENTLDTQETPQEQSAQGDSVAYETGGNFLFAIFAGLAASLIGAVIWTVITVVTNYQIGFMAIGVGFLTGFAVQYFGRGSSPAFGGIGAAFALVGCILGNLFSIVHFGTAETGMGFFELLFALDVSTIVEVMVESFQAMDALFYGLALYTGFKYSFS